jgi:hypothetical protein
VRKNVMPKIKTTFANRGIHIDIDPETACEGFKAKLARVTFGPDTTITDLVKASLKVQGELSKKSAKAKARKTKKPKSTRGRHRLRGPKPLPQIEMLLGSDA